MRCKLYLIAPTMDLWRRFISVGSAVSISKIITIYYGYISWLRDESFMSIRILLRVIYF